MRLPALADTAVVPSSNGKHPASERPLPPLRTLVIDDNVDAAESLAVLLTAMGLDVRTAYDGPTGLTAAADFHPQVVLLDIGLPKMDGYEVARRMRCNSGASDYYSSR